MYPPPSPDIIAQLVGCEVELISFGRYTVNVYFGNKIRLDITCPFRFGAEESMEASEIRELPLAGSDMPRVLGSSVHQSSCETDGTLHLRFTNGDALIAYANNPGYEAYTLEIDGKVYVV